jgi:hypothetical protein
VLWQHQNSMNLITGIREGQTPCWFGSEGKAVLSISPEKCVRPIQYITIKYSFYNVSL